MITSLDNKEIKRYTKLKQKKYREEENLFLVEGEHLVKEAEKAGVLYKVIVVYEGDYEYDSKIVVTEEIMKKLSTLDTPPDIIGVCKIIEEKKELGNKILLLDGIQDPGNLGTIIRSAVAFSSTSIILSEDTVDLYNPKVVRATQGLLFHINVLRRNLEAELIKLKENGYCVYTTDVEEGEDIQSIEVGESTKIALIMGNEGNGVRDEVSSFAEKKIYIKTNPIVESLNVGVATSILLYELSKEKEDII